MKPRSVPVSSQIGVSARFGRMLHAGRLIWSEPRIPQVSGDVRQVRQTQGLDHIFPQIRVRSFEGRDQRCNGFFADPPRRTRFPREAGLLRDPAMLNEAGHRNAPPLLSSSMAISCSAGVFPNCSTRRSMFAGPKSGVEWPRQCFASTRPNEAAIEDVLGQAAGRPRVHTHPALPAGWHRPVSPASACRDNGPRAWAAQIDEQDNCLEHIRWCFGLIQQRRCLIFRGGGRRNPLVAVARVAVPRPNRESRNR